MLSPREYYALRDVEQAEARRWATSQAINVNMNLSEGAEPFTADDFLGAGNRHQRQAERQRGQVEAARLRSKLTVMRPLRPGEPEPEDIPDWARKEPKRV